MRDPFALYPSLHGRVVFVTGGATGIGESFVRLFASQSARVAFIDIDTPAGEGLAGTLAGENDHAPIFLHCDVRDIGALHAAIAHVNDKIGPVSVLINNAAHDERHATCSVSPAYWDDKMAVNLRHHFFAAQAVYPMMKAAGTGSIINLGSVSWMLGMPEFPAYTAAKAAVHGLTKSLARDFGPAGIRVNEICPGAVITDKQRAQGFDEATMREHLKGRQALNGLIECDDIARMALFLASDDARMCTGQRFTVDGGWV